MEVPGSPFFTDRSPIEATYLRSVEAVEPYSADHELVEGIHFIVVSPDGYGAGLKASFARARALNLGAAATPQNVSQ